LNGRKVIVSEQCPEYLIFADEEGFNKIIEENKERIQAIIGAGNSLWNLDINMQ